MMQKHLLQSPLYKKDDLGTPLPPSEHSCSVCLPTWQDVIGYEENDPEVIDKLQLGYPRFVFHPLVEKAFNKFAKHTDMMTQIYSTELSAEACASYIKTKHKDITVFCEAIEGYSATAIYFPEECAASAKEYWQHTGEGISSRYAQALINEVKLPDSSAEFATIKKRIAKHTGASVDDIYLFSCGMSAISSAQQACNALSPGLKSAQFAFPYSDSLKLQEKLNTGTTFYPHGNKSDFEELEKNLSTERISALQCEFPTNPLLTCVDINRLATLGKQYQFPLIIDDTIASYANVELLKSTDILVTSLTKFFSGSGEVMGGAIVINQASAFKTQLHKTLSNHYTPENYCSLDVIELEKSSHNYSERLKKINAATEILCDYLLGHPKVEKVYYPKYTGKEIYDDFKKEDGGYGGVFSILLKNAEHVSETFYNNIQISKGPNLGTVFSLACPFTILAHYHELEFAENAGASRWLIRFSIGLEDTADLLNRFDTALDLI